jgi:hypothetical protein
MVDPRARPTVSFRLATVAYLGRTPQPKHLFPLHFSTMKGASEALRSAGPTGTEAARAA